MGNAAISRLAVIIGIAFAQMHRTLGLAACWTHDPCLGFEVEPLALVV